MCFCEVPSGAADAPLILCARKSFAQGKILYSTGAAE